ncbi:hypothetical protein WQ54_02680 [Bacillus sp. SA1-12]|uniref:hypothetical protein n=1 Tax=Bacillus sp. SA1-12 TaxID=1455638 RepID=UPI0006268D8B|nr:hypothetical protein [Bacillus sp. SA1-12]KKI93536.1 hypothetical protein WQ54_02680 [Bacillus sp. SA1-12]
MSFRKRREHYKRKRKAKSNEGRYTFADLLFEVLFYIPELLLFPFRVLWYVIRFIFRAIDWS